MHAELSVLFALGALLAETFSNGRLQSFALETTLKPCRMCASFLHVVRGKTDDFAVRYEEDDPGPLARHTLLDQFGYGQMR